MTVQKKIRLISSTQNVLPGHLCTHAYLICWRSLSDILSAAEPTTVTGRTYVMSIAWQEAAMEILRSRLWSTFSKQVIINISKNLNIQIYYVLLIKKLWGHLDFLFDYFRFYFLNENGPSYHFYKLSLLASRQPQLLISLNLISNDTFMLTIQLRIFSWYFLTP